MTAQNKTDEKVDAVVIGGGFYGCVIAIYLAKHKHLKKILLLESEPELMTKASFNNQARVHNGYHYPRSFITALRSRMNLPRFVKDWPDAVKADFTKLYAIARRNSKVTAKQFQRFCKEIGAILEPANINHRQLFESRLIEEVYLAQEYVFDSHLLAKLAKEELEEYGVNIVFQTTVSEVHSISPQSMKIHMVDDRNQVSLVDTKLVFNCTYSGLNLIGGDFEGTTTQLKHEITEMALVKMPPNLASLGITVMDGPFFSIMPFPPRQAHTVSHVRYTPHLNWMDSQKVNPYQRMANYHRVSQFERMQRDIERYLPGIAEVKYTDSLYEIKTVLVKNEVDDGRPILFEQQKKLPGFYSILGGKIDNVYDIFEKLRDAI